MKKWFVVTRVWWPCFLIFLAGMITAINIAPYVDSAHYTRHYWKAIIAVVVALSATWGIQESRKED